MRFTSYGQAALEFVMLVGLGLIFLMVIIIIGADLSAEYIEEERAQKLLDMGYFIQNEMILATTLQEGYSYALTLPEQLGSFNYEITSQQNAVLLSSASQTYTFLLPEYTGTFVKGSINTISYTGTLMVSAS